MVFIESFLNGMAQALGFLAVFAVVFIVLMMAWLKLWPRLFGVLMNGISPIMTLMMASRTQGVQPPPRPTHLCANCGFPMMAEHGYCPNCGVSAAESQEGEPV